MKLLIVLLITLFAAVVVYAEPFLTCDPQAGVTKYKFVINGVESISDAQVDGSAWVDMVNIPNGVHDVTLSAGENWTIDNVIQEPIVWSVPSPFVLKRPGVLNTPTNESLKNNH